MPSPETRWRLELIAERVAARDTYASEPAPLSRMAATRQAIEHDDELAWLRDAELEPDEVAQPDEPAVPRGAGEQLALALEPVPAVARARRVRRRRWRPRENRRVQLRRLGLTPGTYRPGRIVGHLTRKERRTLQAWPRPTSWGACAPGSPGRWWGDAPCPYLSCRANLGLDVSAAGSIRVVLGLGDGRGSCALELAQAGTRTLEEVAELEGCTREAVRLIEASALLKIRAAVER